MLLGNKIVELTAEEKAAIAKAFASIMASIKTDIEKNP